MSYDLMIWEGKHPATEQEALELLTWHYSEYYEDTKLEPAASIVEFVKRILEVWPDLQDLPEDDDWTSPWSTSHLIEDASGPFIQVPMTWPRAEETAPVVARVARELGLVCIDGNGFIYSESSGVSPAIARVNANIQTIIARYSGTDSEHNGHSKTRGGLFGWFRRNGSS